MKAPVCCQFPGPSGENISCEAARGGDFAFHQDRVAGGAEDRLIADVTTSHVLSER